MLLSIIPPFRVNYTFSDLLSAIFVKEDSIKWKGLCASILGQYFNNKNVFFTSSGRSGLYLILKTLPQQKVFVPAYTCPVVVEAIMLAGKEIVYVNTSASTFNADCFEDIDDNSIVIATHQYGNPCKILTISNLCKEKGAILIEDCAAALGTIVNNQPVGTFGDFAIFSFNTTKLLTAPSMGGCILCKNEEALDKIVRSSKYEKTRYVFKLKQMLRSTVFCLAKNKYVYPLIYHLYIKKTINHITPENLIYKLDKSYLHPFYEWQAKVLYKQLLNMRQIIRQRKELFEFYDKKLNNPQIHKPLFVEDATCCRYTIRVDNREYFYNQCVKNGIDMDFSFHHIICPDGYVEEKQLSEEILNIPFYWGIKDSDRDYIIHTLNSICC